MDQILSASFSWLLAVVTWVPLGNWLLGLLRFKLEERPIHQVVLATCFGATVATTLFGVLSFWTPINSNLGSALALITVVFLGKSCSGLLQRFWNAFKIWKWYGHLTLLVLVAISMLITVQASLHNDSGLYYIQFIKWINSYPVVPGLANLHDRLGFNSHWHLLSAAYNSHIFFYAGSNDLNGLLFVLIGLASVASAMRLAERPSIFDAVWAVFPLPFFLLIRFLTSTSPDLPSAIIPVVFLSLLLQKQKEGMLPVFIIAMTFAVTIKVTSLLFTIALLPIIFWTVQNKEWQTIGTAAVVGLLVIAPWLIRNVIQTGYIIFPMESIDLFSFDWKVPNQLAANTRMMVSTHAKMGTYDLTQYGKPMSQWFPFWLSVQSKTVLGIFVLVASTVFLLLAASLLRIDRRLSNRSTTVQLFLALTVLASLAFWWVSGPNPRFVYGVVFFFLAYSVGSLAMRFGLSKWLQFAPLVALIPMLLITRQALNESPPKKPTEFATMEHVNGNIYYPVNTDKCWDYELPCANMDRTDLQFRGEAMEDGFVNTRP